MKRRAVLSQSAPHLYAMTPEETGRFVCTAFEEFIARDPSPQKWDALRDRLSAWFGGLDEKLAFAGMMWVFEHTTRYQCQELAAELLVRRPVPLFIPPDEFVRRVSRGLNSSAREVPRYLRAQVGLEEAQRIVLACDPTDESRRIGIAAFRHWLGLPRTSGDA